MKFSGEIGAGTRDNQLILVVIRICEQNFAPWSIKPYCTFTNSQMFFGVLS